MTSLPARVVGLQTRGQIRPGTDADLVAFDPQVMSSSTTYERLRRFSERMPYVMVNGDIVVGDGEQTGRRPATTGCRRLRQRRHSRGSWASTAFSSRE
jgi:N-acyl-D-amino-acid deacylase